MKKLLQYYLRAQKYYFKSKYLYLTSVILTFLLLFLANYTTFKLKDIVNALETGENLWKPVLEALLIISLPILIEPIAFRAKGLVSIQADKKIKEDIYKNVMNQDYRYHVDKETGRITSIILRSEMINRVYLYMLEWFALENIAAFVIPIILIATISLKIAFITLIIVVIMIPLINLAVDYNIKKRKYLKESQYKETSAIIDSITNYETVRNFARIDSEQTYIERQLAKVIHAHKEYDWTFRIMDVVSRFASILVFGVVAIYLLKYEQGNLTNGELVVIIVYLITLSQSIIRTIYSVREIFKELPIIEDCFELLDADNYIPQPKKVTKLENPKGEVIFKDVNFQYSDKKKTICNLNFRANPGNNIALVGPSGGGKTTIIKLLMRYYDPQQGSILIDGVDIRELGSQQLNDLIGVVPQEPNLFNRSILYNIGYALDNDEDNLIKRKSEIIEAAKKAQLHDFIETLPDGYLTEVGERGVKLSGGQKQRIAIARVLIKNPRIIIFDEATSMLDSESERAIQKAFQQLDDDATIFIIAHRLSTITHCDNILVIDNGNIAQQGKHKDLIEKKGLYSKLWNIQSTGFKN